ncbi:reverse transcriptase [Abeliophyllum distichum]|uniref:Reverse transcriptase n=1 Tax=Abeliophyllum distichum TaxID=126358 RepID=A0ABD1SZ64_9LAMI
METEDESDSDEMPELEDVGVEYPIEGEVLVASANGIEVDEEKIKCIKEWPMPKSVTDVRSFHVLASFYRHFVNDFSTLATLLIEIVKKNVGFNWNFDQENAFEIESDAS